MTRHIGRLLAGGGVDYSKPAEDQYAPWRAAGVNPPIPPRRVTMPATSPAKAVLAAIAAALASFLATVQGRTDLATMRAIDWLIVLVSAAVTGIGVYLVPNRPAGTRRNDVGQSALYIALTVLVVLVIVWLVLGLR